MKTIEPIARSTHRSTLAYVIASLLMVLLPLCLPMAALLGRLVPDDGFYYLKIAENLAKLHRQTFDGIHWTNGYHPLWGWVLAAFMFPARLLDTDTAFRAAVAFNAGILAFAGWSFAQVLRRLFPSAWFLALPLFAALLFFSYVYLMETAVLLLFITACFMLSMKQASTSPGYWVAFGLSLACLGLSRLDSVFLGAALFSAVSIRTIVGLRAPTALRLLAVGLAAAAIPLLAWLLWTHAASGHWTTISGALKLNLSAPQPNPVRIRALLGLTGILSLASGLLLLVMTVLSVIRHGWNLRAMVSLVLVSGCFAHVVFHTIFVTWGGFTWAVAQYRLMPILLTVWVIETIHDKRGILWTTGVAAWGFLAATAALYAFLFYRDTVRPQVWTYEAYKAGKWAKANLPKYAVIGMKDSGALGYFAERPVVNLDGLVNDWNWQFNY